MQFSINGAAVTIAVALLTACTPEAKQDPAVEAMRAAAAAESQMLASLATWIEAWDTGNTDTLDAITAPGVQRTAPDVNANGLEEYKAVIAEVRTVYPDFRITNDGSAVGADGGFVQWTVTGTDSGTEDATGNALRITGISRYQFEDGKIISEFVVFDTAAVLSQLKREELPRNRE